MLFHQLTIKAKLLIVLLLLNLTLSIAFTAVDYRDLREQIIDGIDKHLGAIAYGASHILPASFYANIQDASSVKPEDYQRHVESFTRYAQETGATYVYSFMKFGHDIVFINNNADERDNPPYAPFFSVHKTASPTLRQVFSDRRPWVGEDRSETFGTFRSVYLPFTTDNGKVYVVGADIALDFVDERLRTALQQSLIEGFLEFLLMFFAIYFLVDKIIKPLNQLNKFTSELGEKAFALDRISMQRLDAIADNYSDEVGELGRTLKRMLVILNQHFVQLRAITAAQERVEGELQAARNIQRGILPQVFPAFPTYSEFDLHAVIEPAKAVSGDLYDYFMMDRDRLFFMIGDVSDKGIPAALFMAITRTLFKSARRWDLPISAILSHVNQELAAENPSEMFVTVFAGILNLKTGELEYGNAGHESPLVYRRGLQRTERLTQPLVSIGLGLIEDFIYPVNRTLLQPGDTLLLFTKGVSQATNAQGGLFTVQQIETCLCRVGNHPPDAVIANLLRSVHEHAGNAPQSDDITALALRYNG
jgi:sigma-B regulation protein RsbU (phosphoserine phosphatase)